ncbi:sugar phosphate isomerase/epimerase [Synechococcus sp. UW105]|uniref:sugar phosphate isomerase/epimerase family protein n=1 Tax=Synechococcus sp. UW105 TaxID=337067 RepID=UPI000E0E8803|nr:sugar phosphate isomerase/epimerase [Synechococcus sp. UW105]
MAKEIGFMQGRLSDLVDGKIQAFPWKSWRDEFIISRDIGISLMEWTLDQDYLYQNPLMTLDGQQEILYLSKCYDLAIPSLTGDCFMQAPFWKSKGVEQSELIKDFFSIARACSKLGIQLIIIPLVDDGAINSSKEEDFFVEFMVKYEDFFKAQGLRVAFESDLPPKELGRFISRFPHHSFGINYDIGNSASLGYNPVEELSTYGKRVVNVHVKDRLLGGTTVPLGSGNADFNLVFLELAKIKYHGNYILQTARSIDGDHANLISQYFNSISSLLVSSKAF